MADKSNPHLYPADRPPSMCIVHGKVHSTEKMHLLDKVLSAHYLAFLNAISDYFCKTIHGKPTDNEFRVNNGKSRSDFHTNYKI